MQFDSAPGEQLSRYLLERSKFAGSTGRVKHPAFMPPTNKRLSVYCTTGLPEPEIWQIGQQHVEVPIGKPVLARADLNSLEVYNNGLTVELDRVPHPRHANVVGWDGIGTEVRLIAMKLADAATLVLAPGKE